MYVCIIITDIFLIDMEYFHMAVTKLGTPSDNNDIPLLETISSFPNLIHFIIETVRSSRPELPPDNNIVFHCHL